MNQQTKDQIAREAVFRPRFPRRPVKCDTCGIEFLKQPARIKNTNFCNRLCQRKYKNPELKSIPFGNHGVDLRQYANVHQWLRKVLGPATKCEMCGTTSAKKTVWALKKGCKYERKIENFMPLCASCHNKYDNIGYCAIVPHCVSIRITHLLSGAVYNFDSIEAAAKALNLPKSTIGNTLRRQNKSFRGEYLVEKTEKKKGADLDGLTGDVQLWNKALLYLADCRLRGMPHEEALQELAKSFTINQSPIQLQ